MQRESSSRIKPRPLDALDDPTESSSSEALGKDEDQREALPGWRCSHRALLYTLAVCLLTLLAVFLRHSEASYWSFSVLSLPHTPKTSGHGEADSFQTTGPDSRRPAIVLHPEEHVYREPKTQHLNWRVTTDELRPDGVLKRVYLINNLFPGPTIEARSSDTLLINVTNALDESITIHWHGLHIDNSMDGVASVTQCAISPGSSFLYNISIPSDQSGTFWYHSHAGLARADGLYGGFVVHEPVARSAVRGLMNREADTRLEYEKSQDVLLLIGDWYHRPASQVMAWYMQAASFGNEPVPDSLLVNGLGYFNCSMAVPARPLDCIDSPLDLLHVLPEDDVYRVRVVNTGALAGFKLTFGNHDIAVLEVDSMPVKAQDGSSGRAHSAGILYPGQRMDLGVRRAKHDKPSFLRIDLDKDCLKYPNPALNPSQSFAISHPADGPSRLDPGDNESSREFINIQELSSSEKILAQLPRTATVNTTAVVYTKIEKLSIRHNVPYGFFNRTSWVPQANPATPLNALSRDRWDKNQFSLTVNGPSLGNTKTERADEKESGSAIERKGEWVDLVVNNLDEGGHPFHLHGHHFYILTVYKAPIGWGSYNPYVDSSPPGLDAVAFPQTNGYDISRAMLRDTVYISSRGYAVIRFRADNPGPWLFHCHILWHLANGMAMIVDVTGLPVSSVGGSQCVL